MELITYHLPQELIAQFPLEQRDNCRLLFLGKESGTLKEHLFSDLFTLLVKGDLLVVNDTKVQRARLYGVGGQTGRKCEIFLVDKLNENEWICLVRPGKRARPGNRFYFSGRQYCEVKEVLSDGSRRVQFFGSSAEDLMELFGRVPLPPYISREDTSLDRKMYQTVYAQDGFSIAAPTAGLHFTPELLSRLSDRGVEIVRLRLDIGRGTFRPIEVKHYEKHRMDPEEFWISKETASKLNKGVKEGRRILAVGTSSARALEGCWSKYGKINAGHDDTDLFIFPGFQFQVVTGLITNFHLPQSSLLAMVAAFAGTESILKAYEHAVQEQFRFYSYGDAMLIA